MQNPILMPVSPYIFVNCFELQAFSLSVSRSYYCFSSPRANIYTYERGRKCISSFP